MVRDVSHEIGPEAARAAASGIYISCFPLLLAEAVRRAHPMVAPRFHLIAHDGGSLAPGVAEDDARVVLTSAWIDLAAEPVVVRLPNTNGRFFSVTLIDTAGEPFESLGTRTGDDAGLDLALVGPRWRGELPSGLRAKRAPSDGVWLVSRIHAHSTLDQTEALAVARRQCLALLQPHADQSRPALSVLEPPASPCLRQVAEIDPAVFFHRLKATLERAPVTYQRALNERVATLADELDGPPPAAQWSAVFRDALARGFADGLAAIRAAALHASGGEHLGWRALASGLHDRTMSALALAARAYASLGAPLRDDLLSFVCERDETGRPFSGAHQYRIHFPREASPPSHAFWWLSARPPASYDQRHGLGDRSGLTLNRDGSLDLVIQQAPPPAAQIPNWLPAPDGRFSLIMRLYCPAAAALSGAWRMPPVQRLDSGSDGRRERGRPPAATFRGGPTNELQPAFAWRMTP